jgi:regulator of sirC expression with transglutaminase-like and TPR domain
MAEAGGKGKAPRAPAGSMRCLRGWDASMIDPTQEAFARALADPEPDLDLGRAALLIARAEYPRLEMEHYLRRLDALADSIGPEVALEADPLRRVAALNRFLFVTEGFRGNTEQYYDPRNSFLNDVLDRKMGIPITLSTVYLEVARRLHLPVLGVGFPGHFLVKYVLSDREILIDPFHRGAILTEADCRRRLQEMTDGSLELRAEHLRSVTKRQILARILANLKHIYLRARNFPKALRVIDLLVVASPDDAAEVRDRGLLLAQTGRPGPAARDLERYLTMAPKAEDGDAIKEHLEAVRRRIAGMN